MQKHSSFNKGTNEQYNSNQVQGRKFQFATCILFLLLACWLFVAVWLQTTLSPCTSVITIKKLIQTLYIMIVALLQYLLILLDTFKKASFKTCKHIFISYKCGKISKKKIKSSLVSFAIFFCLNAGKNVCNPIVQIFLVFFLKFIFAI